MQKRRWRRKINKNQWIAKHFIAELKPCNEKHTHRGVEIWRRISHSFCWLDISAAKIEADFLCLCISQSEQLLSIIFQFVVSQLCNNSLQYFDTNMHRKSYSLIYKMSWHAFEKESIDFNNHQQEPQNLCD